MNIIQLKEKSEEKKYIEQQLKKAESEHAKESDRLQLLRNKLNKEHKDVQRIEEGGIGALFYELLGTKDKKLHKEKQEFVAAQLKFDNCQKGLTDLHHEIEKLKRTLLQLGHPEKKYKEQLELKKSGLRAINDSQFNTYEDLLQACFAQKREVKEAMEAGQMALKGLDLAIHALGNAQTWGTIDMVGGGLLSTAVKHSKMDEARGLIQDVQYWLRKFNRELKDVNVEQLNDMDLKLDGFIHFADYFFDNLITDWVVQSKINRSHESCEQVRTQVHHIVARLRSSDELLSQKYKSTSQEFTSYVEKS